MTAADLKALPWQHIDPSFIVLNLKQNDQKQ